MRVNICDYEVEIRAKHEGNPRFNKRDTLFFLCALCVELANSKENYEEKGFDALARVTQRSLDSMHGVLDENDFYNMPL